MSTGGTEHVTIEVTEIDEEDMTLIEVRGTVSNGISALPVSSFPGQSCEVGEVYSGQVKDGAITVDAIH